MKTIKEGKEYLRKNWKEGTVCPCCTQFVKRYKRKINSGMAVTLIRIYKANYKDWIHVKNFLREQRYQNSHDWTHLRHWKLIEKKFNEDSKKKYSGVWRVTDYGEQFVLNKIFVPGHGYFFNNRYYGFSDDQTTIVQALGNDFDYKQLMKLEL